MDKDACQTKAGKKVSIFVILDSNEDLLINEAK